MELFHCMKSASIWCFSCPYFPAIRTEYGDQKNSKYGHFSSSVSFNNMPVFKENVQRLSDLFFELKLSFLEHVNEKIQRVNKDISVKYWKKY